MKKWNIGQRPSCMFIGDHRGRIGGGEIYSHQLAHCISTMTDFRYVGPAPYKDLRNNHGFFHRFLHTNTPYKADIFVNCSHFIVQPPSGDKRNIFITFFPNKKLAKEMREYDTIITCSDFSALWVRNYTGKKATVINPYIDPKIFYPGNADSVSESSIINVSRFLREADGHGKRQDVLIKAFSQLVEFLPNATLKLCGSVLSDSDQAYLDELRATVGELGLSGKITFHANPNIQNLASLYRSSQFYWHANGFGQKEPFKTEHFGIVIAESMASGCIPVIYKDGGYDSFDCPFYSTIDELVGITLDLAEKETGDFLRKVMVEKVAESFTYRKLQEKVKSLLFLED